MVTEASPMQASVATMNSLGVLFVASAGNDGVNTDTTAHYPSSLPNPNVIAVAASQRSGGLWPGSNYGCKTVHVAAPGEDVLGLGVGGTYVSMTGTSMATPHVSGAAALVMARYAQGPPPAYHISRTNRMQFVLLGMQNMKFGPYLVNRHRILIPAMSVSCSSRHAVF
jgi:subtilisin family serine protease